MSNTQQTTRKLIELFSSEGLLSQDGSQIVGRWSDEKLREFLAAVHTALDECTAAAIKTLQECREGFILYPEHRFRRKKWLLRRSLLYADWVILPIRFPIPNSDWKPDFLKDQTARAAKEFADILAFVQSGPFLPVNASLANFEDASNRKHFLDRLLSLHDIKQIVSQHAELGIRSEKTYSVDLEGNRKPIEFTRIHARFDGSITASVECHIPAKHTIEIPMLPVEGVFRVPSGSELQGNDHLRNAMDGTVVNRMQGLLDDWNLATGLYKSTLITGSEIAWEIIRCIEEHARTQSEDRYPTERAVIELDLPFLDNVPVEMIVEEKEKNQSGLAALRAGLDAYAEEVSRALAGGASERDIQVLRAKHIDTPLRDLDIQLREINRKRFTELVGSAILMISTVAIAVYGGQPPAVGIASGLISGGSALKIVDSLAKLLSERASLPKSTMHLLWQFERRGPRPN